MFVNALMCAALNVGAMSAGPIVEQSWTFDDADHTPALAITHEGEGKRKNTEPRAKDGSLQLLESFWRTTTSAAIAAPSTELARVLDVSFDLSLTVGAEGMGFAWLNNSLGTDGKAPVVEKWEEPSIPGSFAVGFDAADPVNFDPFRGSGNIYNRPQHEISLHWDGMEIVKRVSTVDFRGVPDTNNDTPIKPHAVRIRVEYVTGGANVSMWIDGEATFDKYFIASMTPYVGRPVFGARNADTAGDVSLDNVKVSLTDAIAAPEAPTTIVAIDKKINDTKNHRNDAVVEFPADTDRFGRIIAVLTLAKPETKFDPWDRLAHVFAYAEDGTRYELIRYITPYSNGHEWKVDVSDFRPILKGSRKIEQFCATQGEGWLVSLRFEFYPGPTDRFAARVINLWTGSPEVGNPDNPIAAFYASKSEALAADASAAKVRVTVTGHGMSPNSRNAAEFMPINRTLAINGQTFQNLLWKTDNYLNPCRPQGGTWKYDRAGWAPGDVVRPWEVEVPMGTLGAERSVKIDYTLDEFINEGRGKTWAPTHVTESQLVIYRAASANGATNAVTATTPTITPPQAP